MAEVRLAMFALLCETGSVSMTTLLDPSRSREKDKFAAALRKLLLSLSYSELFVNQICHQAISEINLSKYLRMDLFPKIVFCLLLADCFAQFVCEQIPAQGGVTFTEHEKKSFKYRLRPLIQFSSLLTYKPYDKTHLLFYFLCKMDNTQCLVIAS